MKIPNGMKLDRIDEAPLVIDGTELGWESSSFLCGLPYAIGGGFNKDRELARQVAVAEAIERFLVMRMIQNPHSPLSQQFRISINDSTSGFAVGQKPPPAVGRAVCEAFEHFVRYHAVYRGLRFDLAEYKPDGSEVSQALAQQFDRVWIGEKIGSFQLNGFHTELNCRIVVAEKAGGIFLGAKAGLQASPNLVEHSLVEAWRSLSNWESLKAAPLTAVPAPRRRTFYFAENAEAAIAQFNSNAEGWPQLQIELLEYEFVEEAGMFLARALFKNVPNWAELQENRLI